MLQAALVDGLKGPARFRVVYKILLELELSDTKYEDRTKQIQDDKTISFRLVIVDESFAHR